MVFGNSTTDLGCLGLEVDFLDLFRVGLMVNRYL